MLSSMEYDILLEDLTLHLSDSDSDEEIEDADPFEDTDPGDLLDRAQQTEDEELGALMMMLDAEDPPQFDWKDEYVVRYKQGFSQQNPGPTLTEPPPGNIPSSYFSIFMDDRFMQDVCNYTNRNAYFKMETDPEHNKGKWTTLTVIELKAYIGVWIIVELLYRDRIQDLWANNPKWFLSNVPGIAEVFTRDRFRQISRYLHFCEEVRALPRNSPEYDKLYKIRFLLNHIQKTFQESYVPDEEVSLDECMVPFRGRLGFKQYIKEKPIKWGVKVMMLAEAKSGYNFNFEVYTGRDTCFGHLVNMGLAQRTVLALTKPLHDKGHCIYFDRFFTSPAILQQLALVGLSACGTVMQNRQGFPPELRRQKNDLQRGQYDWLYCHNTGMVATVWADKRPIYFLSSIHIPQKEGTSVTRHDGQGRKLVVTAPPCVVEYNKHMGGVDRNDRMTSLDKSRKTYRWYTRLFRKSLMWCMYNGFVIKGYFVQSQSDFRSILLDACHELVGDFRRPKLARCSTVYTPRRITLEDHFPVLGDSRDHVCVVCNKRFSEYVRKNPVYYSMVPADAKKKKTVFKCSSVNCQAYLCIKEGSDCWQKWHRNVEYWR